MPKYSDRTIHMLWNTPQYPKFVETCYNSYKKLNPTWDIVLHIGLEDIFDKNFEYYSLYKKLFDLQMSINPTISKLVDIIRIYLLHHYGGIYVDTDTYAIKSFDEMYGINFKSKNILSRNKSFDLNTFGLWNNKNDIIIKELIQNINNFPIDKLGMYTGFSYTYIMSKIDSYVIHYPELNSHILNFKDTGKIIERHYSDFLYKKINYSKSLHINRHFHCELTYKSYKKLK